MVGFWSKISQLHAYVSSATVKTSKTKTGEQWHATVKTSKEHRWVLSHATVAVPRTQMSKAASTRSRCHHTCSFERFNCSSDIATLHATTKSEGTEKNSEPFASTTAKLETEKLRPHRGELGKHRNFTL